MVFSGSYLAEDVTFLLRPVEVPHIPLFEKERLIQSGTKHYSEVLTREKLPDRTYLQLFEDSVRQHGSQLARDLLKLADRLQEAYPDDITLVSLARAGTPIGALLARILRARGHANRHYSISLIRDRGIDHVALDYIINAHALDSIAFIDGWIGKGTIARELRRAIAEYNQSRGCQVNADLFVVTDLAGEATGAASCDDYLIPNAILNSPVSGLVSRSILNSQVVTSADFHACVYYHEFAEHDRSQWFLDQIEQHFADASSCYSSPSVAYSSLQLQQQSQQFVMTMLQRYGARDPNRVKPGIGEATRCLLRRVPERLLLANCADPQVQHLVYLANRERVPIEIAEWMPYRAAALIQTVGQDS